MDDRPLLKGAWSGHMTHFVMVGPQSTHVCEMGEFGVNTDIDDH